VADALRQEPDVSVEEVDGARGEFTVLVDDQVVAQKEESSTMLPEVNEVVNAVRKAKPVASARK
jgi:hypothetical protein